MINDSNITGVIRALVAQTVEGMKQSDIVLGTVISGHPLQIQIDEKNIIDEDFLMLTDNVKDYEVDIEVLHTTEMRSGGSGEAKYESHNHDYTGRKKIIIYNGLKTDEQVMMIRATGGQMFLVVNRVFAHSDVHGQWG